MMLGVRGNAIESSIVSVSDMKHHHSLFGLVETQHPSYLLQILQPPLAEMYR